MHCLFFDIAGHTATFAVVGEENVLSFLSVEGTVTDDALPSHVEAVLRDAGVKYEDLTCVACVVGPGGFTSLRVAVTFANVLSSQLDIPLAGLHLSDVLKARVRDETALWIHSTKKEEVFVRDSRKWPEPTCVSLNDALQEAADASGWYGELIPDHAKAMEEIGVPATPLLPAEHTLPSLLSSLSYHKESVLPWYGRGW